MKKKYVQGFRIFSFVPVRFVIFLSWSRRSGLVSGIFVYQCNFFYLTQFAADFESPILLFHCFFLFFHNQSQCFHFFLIIVTFLVVNGDAILCSEWPGCVLLEEEDGICVIFCWWLLLTMLFQFDIISLPWFYHKKTC